MLARKSSFGGGPSSQGPNAGNAGTTPGAIGGGGGMLDHPSMYHSTAGATNADYGPSGDICKTFFTSILRNKSIDKCFRVLSTMAN